MGGGTSASSGTRRRSKRVSFKEITMEERGNWKSRMVGLRGNLLARGGEVACKMVPKADRRRKERIEGVKRVRLQEVRLEKGRTRINLPSPPRGGLGIQMAG